MTRYMLQRFHDGSVAIKARPGCEWTVREGPKNGVGGRENCIASVFVVDQNKFVDPSHEEAIERAFAGHRGPCWKGWVK